ncbi:hypothetical protein [Chitinophaga sp. CF418]|uniref:hypothetical protein n=1 Tax=Chitinophaga sp. CF418 TaxID=1855287 RepID=UPI0009227312|nr:hypothetical protein [Chitinophaga sp. CF418]SHN08287.1 hypothetical protein SAMN05216311_10569 [Chitinophaga sp. CF418]
MKIEDNKWVISSETAMESLSKTKLNFLTYSDLTYLNSLYSALQTVNNEYHRKQIPNWYLFTTGQQELGVSDFKSFFFDGIDDTEQVFLFSDEGHDNGCFFIFDANDLISFSYWYEQRFNMNFFQFSDYILIVPRLDIIKFNDDEGGINEFIIL